MKRLAVTLAAASLFVALVLPALATSEPSEPYGEPETLPPSVPVDFAVTPAAPVLAPTSLDFSPDGDVLYVASFTGQVLAFPVVGGVALGDPTVFLDGLDTPLGVLATDDGVFASAKEFNDDTFRDEGYVLRAQDTTGDGVADDIERVISGLPNGRHNTNGLALGPDGMLYIANGNSTDSGFGNEGGPPEIPPYSGSVLRVDPGGTNLEPEPDMVVATGWRNIYDLAFILDGHPLNPGGDQHVLAVPENGPDGQTYSGVQRPPGEDTLAIFDVSGDGVWHFGFPWCLYDRDEGGLGGFTQDAAAGTCDEDFPINAASAGLPDDVEVVRATPVALFGMHVSANGLAFNPGTNFPEEFAHDLFVAQWGSIFSGVPHGHKVVRVSFGTGGEVTAVRDFMTGAFPLDLTFGPDGSLWIADFGGAIVRVTAVPGGV